MKYIVLAVVCCGVACVSAFTVVSGLDTYHKCAEMYKYFQVVKVDFNPKVFLADITKIKRDMVVAKRGVIDNGLGLEKLREDFERNEAEVRAEEAKIFVVAQSAKTQASKAETYAQQAIDKTKELSAESESVKLAISQIQKNNLELQLKFILLDNENLLNSMQQEQQILDNFKTRLSSLRAMGRDRRSCTSEIKMCRNFIESKEAFLKILNNIYNSQFKQAQDLNFRINH